MLIIATVLKRVKNVTFLVQDSILIIEGFLIINSLFWYKTLGSDKRKGYWCF